MGRYTGNENAVIGLNESGTYSAESGNFWIGLVQNVNIKPTEGIISYKYIGGNSRNIDKRDFTEEKFDVDITYYPQDLRMLGFAMGSIVDAGSPSPYSHVLSTIGNDVGNAFTSGTLNPFMSFGIEESSTMTGTGQNFVRRVKGIIIDEFELSGKQGEILTATIKGIGTSGAFLSGTTTAINTFSYGEGLIGSITDRPYIFGDVVPHIPSGTIFETMKEFKFNVKNNLIERNYLVGSRQQAAPQPDTSSIMLTLNFDAQSERAKTLYEQYYTGGSEFNAMLFVNASAGSRDNAIILSGCRIIEPFESPMGMDNINEHKIVIEAVNCNTNVRDLLMRYNPW